MKDLDLKHYSSSMNLILEPLHPISSQSEQDHKATGLWLTIDNDTGWKDYWETQSTYCEQPNWLEKLRYRYDIKLCINANILLIDRLSKLKRFNTIYCNHRNGFNMINWKHVATNYSGILIIPYQRSVRLSVKYDWYYTWDCASGVIWDISCIESVSNPIEHQLYYQDNPFVFDNKKK